MTSLHSCKDKLNYIVQNVSSKLARNVVENSNKEFTSVLCDVTDPVCSVQYSVGRQSSQHKTNKLKWMCDKCLYKREY